MTRATATTLAGLVLVLIPVFGRPPALGPGPAEAKRSVPEQVIHLTAKKFEYSPAEIKVSRSDAV